MTSPATAIEVILSFERDLNDNAPARRLRDILDILDDPAFDGELVRELRAINDPDILGDILGKLRRLRRNLEELREKKKHLKDIVVQMGVGGGIGIVGGGLVAAASATFPLIVLIPVIGAAWMAFAGSAASARLDRERHLYEELAKRVTVILGKVE